MLLLHGEAEPRNTTTTTPSAPRWRLLRIMAAVDGQNGGRVAVPTAGNCQW